MMNPLDFRFPCNLTRRQLLWQAGCGFFGTALTYMLAKDGFFASRAFGAAASATPALATSPTALSPLAAKSPHFVARAKSVIFLYMVGGPSHLDTFDPKPELTRRHGQKHSFK